MKTSQEGVDFVKNWESLELEAYQDTGGVWTIGYGHIDDVHKGDTCTEEQAEEWLKNELVDAEKAIDEFVDVELDQNQFDALVSFVYNCGPNAFRTSTLLRLLNNGDYVGASLQFPRWCKDNGKVIDGLLNRRKAEQKLFGG